MPPLPKTRICPSCKRRRAIDKFYLRQSHGAKLGQLVASAYCKECTKMKSVVEWQKKNPDRTPKRHRPYNWERHIKVTIGVVERNLKAVMELFGN